ncbi:phage associated protein, putative [Nitrospirillum viridazoti Y2]|uniref:Uncharacterized protein (TIGR02217 family) n=1 Tax=Nitrospirillum amazonense TaxID=28077 RepID=A0A560II32_9PROT|nr:DUF2460 domain-containing protein [Nitrospirillum amazonense]EGY02280.1 phage associated protein, putative [Nitrospirillum amazonense Y2]TWB58677.1 uncharacterized protein (TIGR02217 family) [Nitrospirillum amazonense]
MAAIYPTLRGRTFGTVKEPNFNTTVQTHNNGDETRISNWSRPRWKITLVYSALWDTASAADFKTLLGFFMQQRGAFRPFLFVDPDDNQVVGQAIAVGDGSTRAFTAVRTFGGFVEPVGALMTVTAVYLNGTPTGGYSFSGNTVTLASAPAAGVLVTADFTFAFVTRFYDDKLSPEKFAYKLWSLGEVNLYSVNEVIT